MSSSINKLTIVNANCLAAIYAHLDYFVGSSWTDLASPLPRWEVLKNRFVALSKDAYNEDLEKKQKDGEDEEGYQRKNKKKVKADILHLQEVQPSFLTYLFTGVDRLNPDQWDVYYQPHDNTYWSDWFLSDPDLLAERPWLNLDNYSNGNAILVRKDVLTNVTITNLAPANSGNRVPLLTGYIDDIYVTLSSVHFDSDITARREAELTDFFQHIGPITHSKQVDIVSGDLNCPYDTPLLQSLISANNFSNPLYLEDPSNYQTTYYKEHIWAGIDHFLIRNATMEDGYVASLRSWEIYPNAGDTDEQNISVERLRCQRAIHRGGSDHYPVIMTLNF